MIEQFKQKHVIENKVIFLDIDGVICTLRAHLAFVNRPGVLDVWDPTGVAMVKRLCDDHDCKIVCISTWRLYDDCISAFEKRDLKQYLHEDWRTKDLRDGSVNGLNRGNEVAEWLSRHQEVTKYIILDDDTDFLETQKPFQVKTDSQDGLSAKNFIDADKILK